MKPPRFTVKALFVMTLMISVAIVSELSYIKWFRSRFSHFEQRAFVQRIENGDLFDDVSKNFDDVEACFSIGHDLKKVVSPDRSPGGLEPTANWTVEVGDTCYMGYRIDPSDKNSRQALKLIFRDNKLIDWRQIAKRNDEPVPHVALRYGTLPFSLPVMAMGTLFYCAWRSRKRTAG